MPHADGAVRGHRAGRSATRSTRDDVCYLSMPLFHSNAVYAGWAWRWSRGPRWRPATFSASRFLPDVRRYGATYMNYVGKPLAYILATAEAARRPRQPVTGRVRQRGQRPRHRRVRPPVRLHRVGRLRVDRERDHHHPRGRLPARLVRQGLPGRGDLRPRDAVTECDVARVRRARRPDQRRRRRSGSWSTPRAAGCSAATTTTPAPPTSACGTACTGRAIWPTAMPTAGSTSPAAPPTGCASTART